MKEKNVLVIGSNAFSGSDFIDLLLEERPYQVIGVSRSPEKSDLFLPYKKSKALHRYTFHQMDLNRDMDRLKGLMDVVQPAYVVNFAAQSEVGPSWDRPEQWFQTNGVAVATLGNYLKDQEWLERYLHISSPEVYGDCSGKIVKEDMPPNPSTPYAASKAAGDFMLLTLVKHYDFPMVMIRSTNVYGAHQQLFKIIPRSVIYLKTGKIIELHGGGQAIKSYIHIRDISRGELAAMEQGQNGEIYHLSPDEGVAVRDVVKMICESMDKDVHLATKAVAERLGQDRAYIIDSSKARNDLGWRPEIGMKEGLEGVVAWVNHYWEDIRREPLEYIHRP
jgi:dTDP-glucose 4,6-dehydratase